VWASYHHPTESGEEADPRLAESHTGDAPGDLALTDHQMALLRRRPAECGGQLETNQPLAQWLALCDWNRFFKASRIAGVVDTVKAVFVLFLL